MRAVERSSGEHEGKEEREKKRGGDGQIMEGVRRDMCMVDCAAVEAQQ